MAHRVGVAMSDGAMPDVTRGEASMNVGDARVTLAVEPGPPVAFRENRFRVRVESASGPMSLEDGRISFEMKMPMGDHRYSLVAGRTGGRRRRSCSPSARAAIRGGTPPSKARSAGEPYTARFRFDLAKQAER